MIGVIGNRAAFVPFVARRIYRITWREALASLLRVTARGKRLKPLDRDNLLIGFPPVESD